MGVGDPGASHALDPAAVTLPDLVMRIEDALRAMAPPWVATGARAVNADDVAGLWPAERAAISRAVPVRQAEFATGRALLRRLIARDVEILVGPDRRPQLPPGVTGTLAHDRLVAVAATATRPTCRALGVDIEPASDTFAEIADSIRRPEERQLDPRLVFVVKEAAYKAWSSSGGGFLDHHDVVVETDTSSRTFVATVVPSGVSFAGDYASIDDRVLAFVVDERDG